MILSDVVKLLKADIFTKNSYHSERLVNYAFSCDLMSDALMILRSVPDIFCEQGILSTGLVTVQGVRTAEVLDIGVILIVRGKKPNDLTLKAAEEANIIIIGTEYTMFSANGKMYQAGIKGISEI